MSRCTRIAVFGYLSLIGWIGAASAETLRCQSVNGNVNCAGSGGVSCQTVDGKKVCSGGKGDVVQSFGGGTSSPGSKTRPSDDDEAAADDDHDDAPPPANRPPADRRVHVEQHGPAGRTMQLDQQGSKLQLHTNRLSVDRE